MKTCNADLVGWQLEDGTSMKISAMLEGNMSTGHSLKPLSFVGESGCLHFLAAYASLFCWRMLSVVDVAYMYTHTYLYLAHQKVCMYVCDVM